MKLYTAHITATGEELCIAARTFNHAADVFVTFWIARTGDAPGQFYISDELASEYENSVVVEAVALGEAAGVIVRQSDGSMFFDPAMGR